MFDPKYNFTFHFKKLCTYIGCDGFQSNSFYNYSFGLVNQKKRSSFGLYLWYIGVSMKMTLGFYIHPVNFLLDCRLLFDAFLGYCLRLSK